MKPVAANTIVFRTISKGFEGGIVKLMGASFSARQSLLGLRSRGEGTAALSEEQATSGCSYFIYSCVLA